MHAKLLAPGMGGVPKRPFDVAGIRCVYGRPVALGAVDESHIVAHGSTAVRYHLRGDIEAHRLRSVVGKFRGVGEYHRHRFTNVAQHVGQHNTARSRHSGVGMGSSG
jgi:hypothetical protein